MFSFLKLIRFNNLLIIAGTQYLVRYTIILPILSGAGYPSLLTNINFFLVVFSTVLIAAGGYVINDYYDQDIDIVNKPDQVIVGKTVSEKTTMNLYYLLTFSGIGMGLYLTYHEYVKWMALATCTSAGLLWFYSTTYKRMLIIGNVLVALLSAFSIFITVLADRIAFFNEDVFSVIRAYSVFAIIMTLIREIIKDMEDYDGDKALKCSTIPIKWGLNTAKRIVQLLILITIALITTIEIGLTLWKSVFPFVYIILTIQVPLLLLLFFLNISEEKAQLTKASRLTKLIMLTGILSMLIFYLNFKYSWF